MYIDAPFVMSGNTDGDWIVWGKNLTEFWKNVDNKNPFPKQRMKVMRFTGLYDEEGKEIYEGDLMTGRETPIEVRWEPPSFVFCYRNPEYNPEKGMGTFSHWYAGWVDFSGKVIGNIYETPELLK